MPKSKETLFTRNLLIRVLSALILIPVVLGAVWAGEWVFFALVAAGCALGMVEWMGLTAKNTPLRGQIALGLMSVVVLFLGLRQGPAIALALSVLVALTAAYYAACESAKDRWAHALWGALGVPYIVWGGLAMLAIRAEGFGAALTLLLMVWATDTGAYFAGRIIGGPKLLPKISPNKTWAGLIGGMVAASLTGIVLALAAHIGIATYQALIGLAIAVVSQAGDFFESAAKRRAGVKDSGNLIPGHGGLLDRIDGLLFAALLIGAYLVYFNFAYDTPTMM